MMTLILIIIFTAFAYLAWRNLRLALIVLTALLPTYLIRFSIGPIPSTALEVFILICFVVWLIRHAPRFRSLTPFILPILLLLAAASFGVTVASDTIGALGIWKAYFVEPILVLIMIRSVINKKDWPKIFDALSISAIIVSAFAIFQYTTGLALPAPWDLELRVTGVFDYPNALGLFLAPIVAMNIVRLFAPLRPPMSGGKSIKYSFPALPQTWGSWRGRITLASVALGLIAIILAQTEAALVAIPAALVATYLFAPLRPPMSGGKTRSVPPPVMEGVRGRQLIAIATAVLLITIALAIPTTREKLLLQDYSGQVRLAQWTETVEMLKYNSAFGAGLNGYSKALEPYHDPTFYEIFQYPHNIILNIWSELGLLGLAAFFWLAWLVIKEMRSAAPSSSPMSGGGSMKLAIFAALAVMVIHGLVDVPYFKNDLAVMTMILLAGISNRN